MNHLPLPATAFRRLESEVGATGAATLDQLYVGANMRPDRVDVVFVAVEGGVEVWVPAEAVLAPAIVERLAIARPSAAGGQLLFTYKGTVTGAVASLDLLLDHPRPLRVGVTDIDAVASLREQAQPGRPDAPDVAKWLRGY
ncbi:MAG: hypothetical protein ACOYOB_19545, partial [Myxococcota bacterium]